VRFTQATRLACACALVFSSLTPLHASALSDAHVVASLRAPLSNESREARVELTAEAPATQDAPAATATTARKRPNLFVRIISAPFRGLAKLFGGGGDKSVEAARVKTNQKKEPQTAPANQSQGMRANAAATRNEPSSPAAAEASSQPAASVEAVVRTGEKVLAVPPAAAASVSAITPSVIAAPPPPSGAAREPFDYVPRPFTPFIEGAPGDYLSQGRALLANGYTTEAIAVLSVAAVTGPDLVEANNLLGLAYDRRGQHKQAREFYERALSVAPQNAQVLNNLGHSLYLDDRYNDALARLKDAARLAPADTRVAGNLALVYGRLRKYDDAFKQFKRVGGEFYARTSTAALLATAGRDLDAIRHYEAARKLNPAAPDVLRQLITLYVRTGQRDKAEAAQRALDAPPVKAGSSASS
jgi:Flp pilus assembly protein TadD